MTNKSFKRVLLLGSAVALAGAGVFGRELVRSGTVSVSFFEHWYGKTALTVAALTIAVVAWNLAERAFRDE